MYSFLKRVLKKILFKYYKLPYALSYSIYSFKKFFHKKKLEKYDLVFVIPTAGRGWILEAVCKEIAAYFRGKYCFHYSTYSLPPSKAYFFSCYPLFSSYLKRNPAIWDSKLLVYYTHPVDIEIDIGISNGEFAYALNRSTKIICMSSQSPKFLNSQGVDSRKTTFVLGGADPGIFKPHQRLNRTVGFCTAYHERKDPDRILNIAHAMSHRKFILLGRNWDKYDKFTELTSLSNFSYVEAPYAEYPKFYNEIDVFVSASKLEGGPIPLIEAMMCNVFPVASKTGFAQDIITHGKNGFLFDVDSSTEEICCLIEKAFQMKADVRKTVIHLNWRNFSHEIQKYL